MRRAQFRFSVLALVVVIAVASRARADGLLYQLPEDGKWVRFHTAMSMHPEGNEEGQKMTASFTMRSVGQETVDNQKCRWIEFELVPDKDEGDAHPMDPIVVKLLLLEDNLQKGKEPLDKIVKGWIREGDREPTSIEDRQSEKLGPVPAFLSGPLKDVKELDKKTIQTKLGELECGGVAGNGEYKQENSTTTVQFETRLHEKAPFGVVSCKMDFETKRREHSEKGTVNLDLEDAGDGAKSSLPDKK